MLTCSLRQFQFAAVALVLMTVATRLPSLLHPQAIDDEAVYSVVANEIVDGGRPYLDAVERKPPLLFWTYAAVFALAGKYNWMALHTVALLWTLGTMAGLHVIGGRLFGREAGLIAALLYSVFQPWATANNLALNGELLMNLPLVLAWAIAFGRSESRLRPCLLGAGALLGAAFLLKQPAAIAAVPLGIYLLLPSYRASRGFTKTESVIQAAMLAIGFSASLGSRRNHPSPARNFARSFLLDVYQPLDPARLLGRRSSLHACFYRSLPAAGHRRGDGVAG